LGFWNKRKEVRFNGFELPPVVVGKTADGWVGKGAMTEYYYNMRRRS